MTDEFPLLPALAVDFVINALDISCTLLFAVNGSDAHTNLSDYVNGLRHRLYRWWTGAQCAAGLLGLPSAGTAIAH